MIFPKNRNIRSSQSVGKANEGEWQATALYGTGVVLLDCAKSSTTEEICLFAKRTDGDLANDRCPMLASKLFH